MGWEDGKASIADWYELCIVGGNQGPDSNVSSCMVKVMEGEGWSDGFGDVLWSGLGISRRARKIGLVVHRM